MRRINFLSLLIILLILLMFNNSIFAKKKVEEQKELAISWINNNNSFLIEISNKIWKYAETALREYKSSQLLIEVLEKAGFKVEKGVAGMPTAFVATYGKGEPVIGILAEYDALPGLSQKVSTKKEPLVPGAPGHGCGHNLFGTASLGAVLAVKFVMEKYNLPGTIKLFGCPAEETVVGKTFMAREGIFDNLSAAIAWHPSTTTKVNTGSSLAMNNFKVFFYGHTAHAASDPWNGRSALDAVELMNIGVNFLREHIRPTARIHYVILNGGKAPNVVPDFAEVWYYVRDVNRKNVEEIYKRVLNIIKGASLMTDTKYKIEFITAVHSVLPNITGSKVMQKNLEKIGAPKFTPLEIDFAKGIQESCNKETKGLNQKIEPFKVTIDQRGGSTDVAEVSRITPTVQLNVACAPLGVPWHSWAVVASSGHTIGHKGMLIATKVMALTAIDFLNDNKLIEKMWKEFKEKTKGEKYKSPLPEGLKLALPKK
ncbi:M20 family metallopeptidase [Candidatus Aminicenantes bacterium AC-335-A11]|jgi:aminobenzoyl-glutamate utilization protein B|nr:M20 family metallopeptidase [SCandidatus Aminicenantes bacterium Aminicenantia_JdfR_composite]MCP2597234.1 M20 family metallopeptidase [Candidatus Aminicenantes bacterium AC-335-G13]MCP2605955.1 M20 family metallopeptidase [Candidatus Aminicenantes bacterium AC-708-I09]MCP2618294.1 M20 family metallopeptidase [Candidatus Aminicenantes bacterium AC-335-A11]MCP2620399.1 M20 family metallopeptidase [Candidatus Aminicenantes bacterium AC-334-E05]